MTVRIPGADALDGPRIGPAHAAPNIPVGDYGLRELASVVQRTAAGFAERADQRAADEAQAAVLHAEETFQTGYIPAAKTYDGTAPGFAQAQLAARDKVFDAAGATLSPAARRRFDQLNLQHRVSAGEHALNVESSATAHWAETQQQAAATARNASAATGVLLKSHTRLTDAAHADATAPDFATQQLAGFDADRDEAIAAAPARDRPGLQVQLASQRADFRMRLQAMSSHQAEAATQLATGDAFDKLRNGVAADPSFLDKAIAAAPSAFAALPTEQRTQAANEAPGALITAAVNARLSAQDFDGAEALLKRPDAKAAMSPGVFAEATTRVTQARLTSARALQAAELAPRVDAELASIRETGKSTGLNPAQVLAAYGPVEGPAKVAQLKLAVSDAQAVHAATADLAALPPADQDARLAALKPQGGEKDFDRRQAIYDGALKQVGAQRERLLADPAAGVQADKTLAASWRAAQGDDAAAPAAWAGATLARQAAIGVSPESRRILPTAEAKRVAHLVDAAAGPERVKALQQAWGYAQRFGAYAPQVVGELARSGLGREDATVLMEAGGDPVALSQYARGREKAPGLKLKTEELRGLEDAAGRVLKPLASTYGDADIAGSAHADSLREVVTTAAKGFMADGLSADKAAEKAAAAYLDNYHLDRGGWRMPAREAQRRVTLKPEAGVVVQGGEMGAVISGARGRQVVSGDAAAREGGLRIVQSLVEKDGAGLVAAGSERALTDAQKRARLADVVAHKGQWRTLLGEDGLVLMIPTPAGMKRVFDKDGRPIERSWAQLYAAAGAKP